MRPCYGKADSNLGSTFQIRDQDLGSVCVRHVATCEILLST